MNVKFNKEVCADFYDHWWPDEPRNRIFYKNQIVRVESVIAVSDNFDNLILENGDVIENVPRQCLTFL